MNNVEPSQGNRQDVKPESFSNVMGKEEYRNVNDPNKTRPEMKKPFNETAFGRTLAGKSKFGRTIHSILDVAPIPNIHEVVKAVIKDEEERKQTLTTWGLLKETFARMDWLRTIVGVAAALLLVKGSQWVGVDVAQLLTIIEKILAL